jgi:hypothetical protein
MSRQREAIRAILKLVERGPARSLLFYWMIENHDRLIAAWPSNCVRWAGLCAEFQARGLTDRNGNPASIRTAKETWVRARKAVEKARAKQAAAIAARALPVAKEDRRTAAARTPSGRRIGTPTPPPTPPPIPPSPGGSPAAETEAEAEARAEANIERMLRIVAERSGRARPDKRTP